MWPLRFVILWFFISQKPNILKMSFFVRSLTALLMYFCALLFLFYLSSYRLYQEQKEKTLLVMGLKYAQLLTSRTGESFNFRFVYIFSALLFLCKSQQVVVQSIQSIPSHFVIQRNENANTLQGLINEKARRQVKNLHGIKKNAIKAKQEYSQHNS